jgi:dynamin 1-like protein
MRKLLILTVETLPELEKFIYLKKAIKDCVNDLLDKEMEPTLEMVKSLVAIEDAHINTGHPDFLGGANAVMNIFAKEKNESKEKENEKDNFSLFKDQPAKKEKK